jgi:hypothetical protein
MADLGDLERNRAFEPMEKHSQRKGMALQAAEKVDE